MVTLAKQGLLEFLARDMPGTRNALTPVVQTSSSALRTYCDQLARHSVLAPRDERELTRRIRTLEIATWIELLTYAPAVDFVTELLEAELEPTLPMQPLKAAAARARRWRRKADSETLDDLAQQLSAQLYERDRDRVLRTGIVQSLRERTPRGHHSAAVGWRRYLHRVSYAERAAERARRGLVESNLRLVVSVARRHHSSSVPLEDLIQDGNIGLMKAVDRFDSELGFRFSTYATWWIRHNVTRAQADDAQPLRIPVHVRDRANRVRRMRRELEDKLGRAASQQELAEAAAVSAEAIAGLEQATPATVFSLDDSPVEGAASWHDQFLAPTEQAAANDTLWKMVQVQQIAALLDHLTPIQADVIRRRFGLQGRQEQTLREIAAGYGLSRERIRQIERDGVSRLRRRLHITET